MRFKSANFEARMADLQEQMNALKVELSEEKVQFVESLKAQGWVEVEHDSDDYEDFHEGKWFLFSPNVPSEVVTKAKECRGFYPPNSKVHEEDYYDLW